MPAITEANRKKNKKRAQNGIDQISPELKPNATLKNAFKKPTAHPQVGKGNEYSSDGLKLDSKQRHHSGVPIDSFSSFTEGFTPEQIKATRKALSRQGLIPGDNMLNSVDLWKRYHQGRSSGPYQGQGAHQQTNALKIDGPKSKERWASLSPKERFAMVDSFVSDMVKNRQIAQKSDWASRQLLGSQNTPDNEYGGNFAQRILSPRNAENAARNAENTKAQRELYAPPVKRELAPHHNGGRRSALSARSMRPPAQRAESGYAVMPEVKLPSKQQILSVASHFAPGPSKQAITALSSGPVQEDNRSTGLKIVDTVTAGLEPIKSMVRQANPQLDEEKDLQQTTNEIQKFFQNPLNEIKWGLKILQSGM